MEMKEMLLIGVEFCITSDSIEPEKITSILCLQLTRTRKENEWTLPTIETGLACNRWEISTEQETSKSVDKMCKKILDKLVGLYKDYASKTVLERISRWLFI